MILLKTPGNSPLRPHLFTALLISLAAHALLLFGARLPPKAQPAPALTVALLPAPLSPEPAEPLLKNTLAEESPQPEPNKAAPSPPQPDTPQPGLRPAPKPTLAAKPHNNREALAAAQRKISKLIFYPPEAVAAGLEGEVRLLITLDPSGRILDVDVAAPSGHAVLDKAAIRAAWAMGSLEGTDKKEMILPVVFRLR